MAGPKSMAPDLAQPEKETWAHLLAGPPPTGGGVRGSGALCAGRRPGAEALDD